MEMIMSFGNIIGNMLSKGMSSQSHNRLRTGAENAGRSGGIEQILGSFMRGSGASGRKRRFCTDGARLPHQGAGWRHEWR